MTDEITYGELTFDEFIEKFDWLCACGHEVSDHHVDTDYGVEPDFQMVCDHNGWKGHVCEQLSDRPITVLELLNLHYGTEFVAGDYNTQLPSKWSHNLGTGPYGRCLSIGLTTERQVNGYEDPMTWANYEVLQENWKDHPALIDAGFSDCNSIGLQWNSPAPRDLIETIESLDNYPALDDERMTELETEWIDEAWTDYGLLDATRELASQLDTEIDTLSDALKDALREDIRWSEHHPAYYEVGGGAVFEDERVIAENLEKYRALI